MLNFHQTLQAADFYKKVSLPTVKREFLKRYGEAPGHMKGENYTLFTFEADNSTLLLHNFIDMTPISATALQAIIPTDQTKYNVIGGTGRFANVSGGSTLLAILDMTEFDLGKVGFDCHYRISFK